jgi:hypothetical protein
MDGRTDRGKTVYPPPTSGNGGIKKATMEIYNYNPDRQHNTSEI